MAMSSPQLIRDLKEIDRLIALLCTFESVDDEDRQDLRWLRATQQSLSALLDIRRAEKGKKVVSLDLWRHGDAIASSHVSTYSDAHHE